MPGLQTVTYVTKGNKIVKTGKSLNSVWKDAQAAYRERKAEIKAVRQAGLDERRTRRALDRLDVDDDDELESRASSRRSSISPSPRSSTHIHRKPVPPSRPHAQRRHTGSSTSSRQSDRHPPRSPRQHGSSRLRFEDHPGSPNRESTGKELVRRNTDGYIHQSPGGHHRSRHGSSTRSASMSELEMSLAYGELPAERTRPSKALRRNTAENELQCEVSRLQQLLDEANCVQHSAIAMINQLQKNPDQLAAVALTLGQISTLATKMGPGALASLKAASPAAFALLASPQFMIAAGVGVGVTVIALGGYKIVKKIKAKNASKLDEDDEDEDELQEIRTDLSRIEVWRRGIADVHAESAATSVDGELITPVASRRLQEEGRLAESDLKSTKSKKSSKSRTKDKDRERRKEKERKKSKHDDEESVFDKGKALIRDPNGIRSLFKKDRRSEPGIA